MCGWLRKGDVLEEIPEMTNWVSPRLKVRFVLADGELQLFGPDGRKFASYIELSEQGDKDRQRADQLAAKLRSLGVDPEA